MKLEELQILSDTRLNEIAAIQILWGGIRNGVSDSWKPCSNMNDAIRLSDELRKLNWFMQLGMSFNADPIWDCKFMNDVNEKFTKIKVLDNNPARAITIAAILAKDAIK